MKVKSILSKSLSLVTVFAMTFNMAFAQVAEVSEISTSEQVVAEEPKEETTVGQFIEEIISDVFGGEEEKSEIIVRPEPEVVAVTGNASITVCKAIAKKVDGEVSIASPEEIPSGYTFTIPWVEAPETPGTEGFNVQPVISPDAIFTTDGFTPEKAFFGEALDSDCVKFSNLTHGSYFYGQEEITGGDGSFTWTTKYSDQILNPVTAFDDVDEYNDNIFTAGLNLEADPAGSIDANNVSYNTNADGHIVLNQSNAGRNRTIVVLNIFEEIPRELSCEYNQNLIVNGGFESPVVTNENGWDIYNDGTTDLGWNVEWRNEFAGAPEIAKLEIHGGVNGWLPSEGEQYAELDTDWGYNDNEEASVTISQDIATIPGQYYELSYDFSPRPGTDYEDNVLRVYINETMHSQGPFLGGANTLWTSYTVGFIADSSVTTISFEDSGMSNSVGTFLDNVVVLCADEPVNEEPVDENPEDSTPSNNGGSSSSGSRRSSGGGSVLGASTGEVLGACVPFNEYHKKGDVGGEVAKIQEFLNEHMNAGLTVDGVYGETTAKAVHAFQQKYFEQVISPWVPSFMARTTGKWYKTTRMMANKLIDCPEAPVYLEDPKIMYEVKWNKENKQN